MVSSCRVSRESRTCHALSSLRFPEVIPPKGVQCTDRESRLQRAMMQARVEPVEQEGIARPKAERLGNIERERERERGPVVEGVAILIYI